MRLQSHDGAQVELRPLRYQFASARSTEAARDWDANWLIIRGDVELADGRRWSFEDPCLTTWEARELGAWLRAVASGSVQPSPWDGRDEKHILLFTEPNVALSLAACDSSNATVRVHLSLESRPPWLSGADSEMGHVELLEFFIEVAAPLEALVQAAAVWEQELTGFPQR